MKTRAFMGTQGGMMINQGCCDYIVRVFKPSKIRMSWSDHISTAYYIRRKLLRIMLFTADERSK